ncbi:MAG: chemotaxis protein CheW [Aestuariibacter sp.]
MMNLEQAQLLSFSLGEDIYGIDITRVQEIRALGAVRKLPNTPSHCIGVVDFRQEMVPILDLRELFGYSNHSINAQTVMIIVAIGALETDVLVGIIVDSVSDVIAIEKEKIKPSPKMGGRVNTDFMKGMFKHEDQIVVVLSLQSLLDSEELGEIKMLVEHEKVVAE